MPMTKTAVPPEEENIIEVQRSDFDPAKVPDPAEAGPGNEIPGQGEDLQTDSVEGAEPDSEADLAVPGGAGVFNPKEFLQTVPNKPGSYRMYGSSGEVIYVGKAKDLKKRLSSYFLKNNISVKTQALVAHIHHIEFTVTFSETEALILENDLIKQFQPRYNILLRDDKSYPYLLLTKHKHPGLYYHRGPKRIPGDYFGPYPDATAAKESLKLLQSLFPIRQCADTVYAHRSRPCLMAQIGKCLAPCVKMTPEQEEGYQRQAELIKLFLQGHNQELLNELTARMQKCSENLEFETAAKLRDQLLALRRVQESQSVSADNTLSLDVIGSCIKEGAACVHVLFIRQGRILGTRSYFPKIPKDGSKLELMSSFAAQFYLSSTREGMMPECIVLDEEIQDADVIAEAVKARTGHKIVIETASHLPLKHREQKQKFLRLASANAQASLASKLSSNAAASERIASLEDLLHTGNVERMECFDISHTQGELTVASCVVFGRDGPQTSRYRRFNIEGIAPGDDFAAMHQVLSRRYKQISEGERPDIVFIDGGPGQLKQAEEVLTPLFAEQNVPLPLIVAVAKGEGRKEGLETLIMGFTHERINLTLEDPALQLILHIRDESHRFAITGHRARRSKARKTSALEQIEGIGPKRRQALLTHLGGRQEIMRAGIDDLKKVPGISEDLAKKIYDALHG